MNTRKILSVIGNISTGKSTFLNYLLGSDILQTGDGLKTRFIVIIRHTEIDVPVLSHVIRKTNAYDDIYKKEKDIHGKEEYKGKEEIIEAISSLNNSLKKEEDEGKLDYSKNLYLLQIRIKNIHNQDFLNSFDLADIPGLNNRSQQEGKFGSIKAIFTPLTGLIQYGFLIFDAYQYEDKHVLEILKQLMSEEKIKFNHFLIILNKIDEKPIEKRKEVFLKFKAYLNYHLGDDLLNDTNSIVTMSSLKLLEEYNVMENFDNFLSYHFKEFINNSKNTNNTIEKYFKRLVANGYYMNNKSEPRKKYTELEKILNPEELDEEFTDHISKLAENAGLKLIFDPEDESYENICKLFSVLQKAFSKKEIYFYQSPSEYRKKIDDFFDNKDFISLNQKNKQKNKNGSSESNNNGMVNAKLLECMEKLKSFYQLNIRDLQSKSNKTGHLQKNINIQSLGERMENLEKLIACHDKIRITVYGTYNAGKSTTLNTFIGRDLLQTDDEQCTRKPILIRYLKEDQKPKIYRAELKSVKDYDKFTHYSFVEKGNALAEGDEAVRNFISSQNIFPTLKDYKEKDKDDFFILKTPIKILDELNLSEEIKNNVEFLDTPGLNAGLINSEGDLLAKLVEQTFIYFFIIDPKVGGTDTAAFNDILENTMLKTIYNRSIINDSMTFPYLFICNKCDNENVECDFENCNKNINLILKYHEKEKFEHFDIIKFSAYKRKAILNKMNEYTPENFIEKVEKDFSEVLYFNSKTFYDYLDDYILKDFKKNFDDKIHPEFVPNESLKSKIIEILKQKKYEISNEKDSIISKLSGYLSFCNNNFNLLKIADNKMMDELKNKIKTKINIAYNHITNGYKIQVKTALDFIKNFILIGLIPDSCQNRTKEEEVIKAQKIIKEVKEILETYNIPETFKNFRKRMNDELESKKDLKDNYDNYEEVVKKKEKFLNENLKQLIQVTVPQLYKNIQNGIIETIKKNINEIDIIYDNGKMIIKENPSMKGTAKNIIGLAGASLVSAGLTGTLVTYAGTEVVIGGITAAVTLANPGAALVTLGLSSLVEGASFSTVLAAALSSTGIFALAAVGVFATIGALNYAYSQFSERKKNAYDDAMKKMQEKFFIIFDGCEKKYLEQFNSKKEKIFEESASYLNMCYYKVELDEKQKEDLINKYNYLQKDIIALIDQ